jgi:hypothetical protein
MFLISPFGHLPRPVGNGMSIAEQNLKNVAIGRLGCFVGDDVQDFVNLGRLLMALLRPKPKGSNPHVTRRSEGARNFSA